MKSFLLLLSLIFTTNIFCDSIPQKPLNIAVLGLGGRAQWLIVECLKLNPNVKVVAVCDDNVQDCCEYCLNQLKENNEALVPAYQRAFKDVAIYSNTTEDLEKLFTDHAHNIDKVFITSMNGDHFNHLNTVIKCCPDKKIFMEKPLFRKLNEFETFNFDGIKDTSITIGLTLRYSSMAQICKQQLQAHQKKLGELKKVKAWEHLNFYHALTAFIMGWRRYADVSGGFLLEKSIHDLDLALFFVDALGVDPVGIDVTTETANKFFIKSRKKELLEHMRHNEHFRNLAEELKYQQWEPVNFVRNEQGNINWQKSFDTIFEEYPEDDNFTGRNLIPDYHKLVAVLKKRDGSFVDMELEVNAGSYRDETGRGQFFAFENGNVLIDIMASKMAIKYNDKSSYEYDLKTNNSDHADGDLYLVHTILDHPLPKAYHMATIQDPIVKLANKMALVSEEQALNNKKKTSLVKKDQRWIIAST